jgi:predicted site-specific integrase-resolvase
MDRTRVLTRAGRDKNDNDLLTEAELCELLKVSPHTAKQWRWAGRGPDYVKMHRAIRYRRADVQRWIARQTRKVAS